jgi:hypothetical protein
MYEDAVIQWRFGAGGLGLLSRPFPEIRGQLRLDPAHQTWTRD